MISGAREPSLLFLLVLCTVKKIPEEPSTEKRLSKFLLTHLGLKPLFFERDIKSRVSPHVTHKYGERIPSYLQGVTIRGSELPIPLFPPPPPPHASFPLF